ncbi:MAG: helix-turn-helix domain-containing protein, partial [Actinomycetales bacterium]
STGRPEAIHTVTVDRCGCWQDAGVTEQAPGESALGTGAPRFLTLADVAETLNISASQAYALVRNGELPAIKVGGRGQWRVEATELEAFIARMYADTRAFVAAHPFTAESSMSADDR